jgi:hypothetical protein
LGSINQSVRCWLLLRRYRINRGVITETLRASKPTV